MSEKKLIDKMVCKHGCGAEFDRTPTGQAALMRHYQYECPNKPQKPEPKDENDVKPESVKETGRAEYVSSESRLSESEILERIIKEVSSSKKIPGIIRMVEWYMDNPKKSFEVLAEALRIGDIRPSDRVLILKNWAAHLKLGDVGKLIESEGKDEDEKKEDKEKKKEEETGDAIDKEIEKSMKDEVRQLQLLRMRKERRMLEKDIEEPKPEPKKEEEEKLIHIINGVTLKVTPQEKLAWMKYESEEREKQEERERRREEQKAKDEERLKRKDDDTVEWPIGDKVIKVRPETIPMLVMQQTQKKEGSSDEMKMVMDKMEKQNEQFHQFQVDVLKKEVDELKSYASQDPLDKLYSQKEKLEKFGLIRSDKMSAQEQLYQMDHKKLDALLSIALDKSKSTENKVNTLLNTIGPAAQDYVREMVLQMKQTRGATAPEVPRSEQQASDTLAKLEEIDKAMESANKTSRVISVGKTGPKPEPPKEGS